MLHRRPDPRLNAYRDDLADARLRGVVAARRFAEGRAARVVAGRAAVRNAPQPQAEIVTFYHSGEEVLVFEEADGVAWCQSRRDGYVGYVAAGQLGDGPPPQPMHTVATLGSYLYEAPDLRSAATDFLPRHSRVTVAETRTTRGTDYAGLATGGYLPLPCLGVAPPRSPDLASAAALYLGCPYLWGGRSFLGIDCSGLVQNAFQDLGLDVLRDTDMQRETIGEAANVAGAADLKRGDLLYMPGHVLIYAGAGVVIHADGASMTVRRDRLADLMRDRVLRFGDFVVRRHPAAAG